MPPLCFFCDALFHGQCEAGYLLLVVAQGGAALTNESSMTDAIIIRPAKPADLADINAIYNSRSLTRCSSRLILTVSL